MQTRAHPMGGVLPSGVPPWIPINDKVRIVRRPTPPLLVAMELVKYDRPCRRIGSIISKSAAALCSNSPLIQPQRVYPDGVVRINSQGPLLDLNPGR
jgi:hypothetical protein